MDEPDFNNSNFQVAEDDFMNRSENEMVSHKVEDTIYNTVYILIFFIGVIGNGIMILIFVRHRILRNLPNASMLCLAVGDLLFVITYVPYLIIIWITNSWPLGISMCKLFVISQRIFHGVSIFTLTVFTTEWYCTIVNPDRRHVCTKSFTLKMLIILILILLATPDIKFTNLQELHLDHGTISFCLSFPVYLSENYAKGLIIFTFLVYYMIPLFVMACFCILMARHLVPSTYNVQQSSQIQDRKKVVKMILTFDIIFAMCLMPQHIFNVWFHFHPNAMDDYNDYWNMFRISGYCLTSINFCSKPVVLYLVSKTFRKYTNHYLFFCLSSSKKLTDVSENQTSDFRSMSLR